MKRDVEVEMQRKFTLQLRDTRVGNLYTESRNKYKVAEIMKIKVKTVEQILRRLGFNDVDLYDY